VGYFQKYFQHHPQLFYGRKGKGEFFIFEFGDPFLLERKEKERERERRKPGGG